MARIYLSPPELTGKERGLLEEALASNWITSLGPQLDGFEADAAARCGVPYAVGLSSGTAALHLALEVLGIGQGDEVWVSTLTFAATANAVAYTGATPVFIDSDERSWNLDPGLLAEALDEAARAGRPPRAVIAVDLYGQCADLEPIAAACARHGVALIEDAAEALGATYRGKPAGAFGTMAILSFNGNKIITTSGGGMLLAHDPAHAARARFLATQAREPARHYEHQVIGYNYRLSNLLAAVGRAQLADLDRRVEVRRSINARYRRELARPGWRFMPEAPYGTCTFWLSCATIDPAEAGETRDQVLDRLAAQDIEGRPVWKPLHLQPVFRDCRVIGGAVAERLFAHGLCLPSGSSLSADDQARVIAAVRGSAS